MKPVYLKHTEIDKLKWDNCVKNSNNHLPYCYSWYLDIVSPDWDALISGNYEFIFPLTQRRKARINYLFQPYFTQQLGLFGKNNFAQKKLLEFLSSIPEEFKFIEINLNTECDLNSNEFKSTNKLTHHLSMNDSHENIFQQFNQNTKRNIRKAEKLNLTLKRNGDSKSLISLFRLSIGKKTDLKLKDYKMLEELMKTAIKNNYGEIYEIRNSNQELEASLFLLSSKNILINLFNASSYTGKKNSSMFHLFNEIIKLNSNSEKIFDFEGSEIPEVAKFYMGFGSKPIYYPSIKLNRLHWSLKWIKK